MVEEGLERLRVRVLCMSANAFGSDWAQLESGTLGTGQRPFRDPLNKERRFLPLRLDDAPIKGFLPHIAFENIPLGAKKDKLRLSTNRLFPNQIHQ